MHEDSCFITLTYDDENLPYGETLVPRHFQLFMKRARKKFGQMRFYHCGEYGETTERPHYHALLFGFRPSDGVLFKDDEYPLYTSEKLTETWGLGHATFGQVTFETAAYTSRYVTKKVTGKQAKDHYTFIDPETGEMITKKPEYSTMSRRPGIGMEWLKKYGKDTYEKDTVIMRGKPMRPPRSYDLKFEQTHAELWEETKKKRDVYRIKKYGEKGPYRLFEDDQTPEETRRLHAGKVIAEQRLGKRNL